MNDCGAIEGSRIDIDAKDLTPGQELVNTAQELLEHRLDSFEPDPSIIEEVHYESSLNNRLELLESLPNNPGPEDIAKAHLGSIIGESLFYIMTSKAELPFREASGRENYKDIDFYLGEKPIDITTTRKPGKLVEKIKNPNAHVVCVPIKVRQRYPILLQGRDMGSFIPESQISMLNQYLIGDLTARSYFETLYIINYQLGEYLAHYDYKRSKDPVLGPEYAYLLYGYTPRKQREILQPLSRRFKQLH
jgi:hypothetical protein